jgi:hypothetical protein
MYSVFLTVGETLFYQNGHGIREGFLRRLLKTADHLGNGVKT